MAQEPGGRIVVCRGETSDTAYLILKGSAAAGYIKYDDFVSANITQEGGFFGEIAALAGATPTANIITEKESEFLLIPSKVMRQLAKQYDGLRQVFYTTMAQRLSRTELPHGTLLDQQLLRELHTNTPAMDDE